MAQRFTPYGGYDQGQPPQRSPPGAGDPYGYHNLGNAESSAGPQRNRARGGKRGGRGRGGHDRNGPRQQPYPPRNEFSNQGFPNSSNPSAQNEKIAHQTERERLCRTLFARSIKYDTSSQTIRSMFEQFGEIKTFFDIVGNRGMAFITFYDLRAAIDAKANLQGTLVQGRPMDVHYSLPKDGDLAGRCDKDKNQGSLRVQVSGAPTKPTPDEIGNLFSSCGEIKMIEPDGRFADIIEFFDSRACQAAFERLAGKPFKGGAIQLEYIWDLVSDSPPADSRPPPPQQRVPRQNSFSQGPRGGPPHSPPGGRNNTNSNFGQPGPSNSQYGYNSGYNGPPAHAAAPPPPAQSSQLEQAQKLQHLLSSLSGKGPAIPPPANANPSPYAALADSNFNPPQSNATYPPRTSNTHSSGYGQYQSSSTSQPAAGPSSSNALPPGLASFLQQNNQAAPSTSQPNPYQAPAASAPNPYAPQYTAPQSQGQGQPPVDPKLSSLLAMLASQPK